MNAGVITRKYYFSQIPPPQSPISGRIAARDQKSRFPLVAIRQGARHCMSYRIAAAKQAMVSTRWHPARRPLVVTLLSDRKAWLTRRDGNRLARTNKWRSARARTARLHSLISKRSKHGSICQPTISSNADARCFTLSGTKYEYRPADSSSSTDFIFSFAVTDDTSREHCQRARRHASGTNQVA